MLKDVNGGVERVFCVFLTYGVTCFNDINITHFFFLANHTHPKRKRPIDLSPYSLIASHLIAL